MVIRSNMIIKITGYKTQLIIVTQLKLQLKNNKKKIEIKRRFLMFIRL